jgi:hypothetical protein
METKRTGGPIRATGPLPSRHPSLAAATIVPFVVHYVLGCDLLLVFRAF